MHRRRIKRYCAAYIRSLFIVAQLLTALLFAARVSNFKRSFRGTAFSASRSININIFKRWAYQRGVLPPFFSLSCIFPVNCVISYRVAASRILME